MAIKFSRQNEADSRARTTYYWDHLVALSSFSLRSNLKVSIILVMIYTIPDYHN